MRHLEQYGERCVAAFEAVEWPEKQAEFEHAEQRMNMLFDRMVQTPAQGPRGTDIYGLDIHSRGCGLVRIQ